MLICIPVTQNEIPNHFGHCEEFFFAEVQDGKVGRVTLEKNPRHGEGGPPPIFVRNHGTTHVLAWGMPNGPRGALENAGIKLTLGARGEPRAVLEAFLAGTLQLTTEKLDAGGCGGKCGGHGHGADHGHDHARGTGGLHVLKPH